MHGHACATAAHGFVNLVRYLHFVHAVPHFVNGAVNGRQKVVGVKMVGDSDVGFSVAGSERVLAFLHHGVIGGEADDAS